MLNQRDLLKEAIADAKAVKETAIANAKSVLEETFTPHLKSMLSAKLEEMEQEDDLDENLDIEEQDMDMEEMNLDELLSTLNENEEEDDMEDEQEEMGDDEKEIDLESMTEEDLTQYIESVISDLHGYVALKQSAKKPRVRKAVPVEKIVAKLKYCKAFKADGLDLVSVPPAKLHNSSEAWVYDTKKRKIHHYVADEYSKTLIVKGNTILGFDKTESGVKTLRKPVEQLKELTGSKPKARKYFKDIKAVQSSPTGRFNENMVILKAF